MRTLKTVGVLVLGLGFGGYLLLWPPGDRDKRLALIDRLATQGVEIGAWPALMWAEVAPGQVIASGAAGYVDIATQTQMDTNVTMPIGSISKVLIGLAAAQASHDGLLNLDAPLSSYVTLPVVFPDGAQRTFTQLATHTSGIVDSDAGYGDAAYYWEGTKHPTALIDFLASYLMEGGILYDADEQFGDWAPGTRYDYSNIGAGLAAQAVTDATGVPFETYSIDEIVKPLNMTGFWGHEVASPPNAATLYERDDAGVFQALKPYGIATWPDGQFNASVDDLALLLATIMNDGALGGEQIFAPEVITLLTTPLIDSVPGMDGPNDKVGLFWTEETLSLGPISLTLRGHSGGDPGVVTFMYRLPDAPTGFVVMMTGAPDSIWDQIRLARIVLLLAGMPAA